MKNNCLTITGHQTTYKVHNKPLRYHLPKNEQSLAVVATEYLDKGEHAVMGFTFTTSFTHRLKFLKGNF